MKNDFKKKIFFKFKLLLLKTIKFIIEKINFFILPDLIKNKFNSNFDKDSRSYIFRKKSNFIDVLKIESTEYSTKLCALGKKYLTDKSPINLKGHRHPYTAVYDLLFNNFQNEKFNYAEIGILNNASIKMFRKYFKKANLYGFEFNKKFIKKAKKDNLKNTYYREIDVKNEKKIFNAFKKTKKKFKIIIEDSTHEFDDQIRVIKNITNFLEPGGYLIIEDIFHEPKNLEKKYYESIKKYEHLFEKIYFIECNHINKYSPGWNNDKLLIMKRNNL